MCKHTLMLEAQEVMNNKRLESNKAKIDLDWLALRAHKEINSYLNNLWKNDLKINIYGLSRFIYNKYLKEANTEKYHSNVNNYDTLIDLISSKEYELSFYYGSNEYDYNTIKIKYVLTHPTIPNSSYESEVDYMSKDPRDTSKIKNAIKMALYDVVGKDNSTLINLVKEGFEEEYNDLKKVIDDYEESVKAYNNALNEYQIELKDTRMAGIKNKLSEGKVIYLIPGKDNDAWRSNCYRIVSVCKATVKVLDDMQKTRFYGNDEVPFDSPKRMGFEPKKITTKQITMEGFLGDLIGDIEIVEQKDLWTREKFDSKAWVLDDVI